METDKITRELAAHKRKNVRIIAAENIKHLAETRAKGEATKILAKSKAYYERQMLYGNMSATIERAGAQRLKIDTLECEAKARLCDAETAQKENLSNLRLFEQNMALAGTF